MFLWLHKLSAILETRNKSEPCPHEFILELTGVTIQFSGVDSIVRT